MTKDEMRLIRRELINDYLHEYRFLRATVSDIKNIVRQEERVRYGCELKAYA